MSDEFNVEHARYIANEVEKMILSESAVRLGQAACNHFVGGLERQFVNLKVYMDNFGEVIDLFPSDFPASMLRQRNDGKVLWTVTVSRTMHATELTSLANSEAGRSRDRNYAALAALIRLYIQDIEADNEQEPQVA